MQEQEFNNILEKLENNDISLSSVDLSGKKIGKKRGILLARTLEKNRTLEHLELGGNFIGRAATIELARVLQTHPRISTLGLTENKLGDDGAKAIAQLLEKNQHITTIKLGNNGIGRQGLLWLTQALEKNISLDTIILADNHIGSVYEQNASEAIQIFARTIRSSRSLQQVDLRENELNFAETRLLVQACQGNYSLTSLILTENNVDRDTLSEATQILKTNTALVRLELIKVIDGEDSGLIETIHRRCKANQYLASTYCWETKAIFTLLFIHTIDTNSVLYHTPKDILFLLFDYICQTDAVITPSTGFTSLSATQALAHFSKQKADTREKMPSTALSLSNTPPREKIWAGAIGERSWHWRQSETRMAESRVLAQLSQHVRQLIKQKGHTPALFAEKAAYKRLKQRLADYRLGDNTTLPSVITAWQEETLTLEESHKKIEITVTEVIANNHGMQQELIELQQIADSRPVRSISLTGLTC